MISNDRAYFESQVLDDHTPGKYRFFNLPSGPRRIPNSSNNSRYPTPCIILPALTNRRNIYNICIELGSFPDYIPDVWVMQQLRTKGGEYMSGYSGTMHTLGNEDRPQWTRICHYGSSQWKPTISIFKVFVRARLWLEMYELHLQTGKPIDYYLDHAS